MRQTERIVYYKIGRKNIYMALDFILSGSRVIVAFAMNLAE